MNHPEFAANESATPAKSPFEIWEERRGDEVEAAVTALLAGEVTE